MIIDKIYVSAEVEEDQIDYGKLNTDVIVMLTNGFSYRANFIAISRLLDQLRQKKTTKSKIAEKYFWKKNMVIVDHLERNDLKAIIEYMIEEGDFQMIFEKL